MSPAQVRLAALIACALMLSGCISLFPKAEPSKLYRLELPTAATVDAKSVEVTLADIEFDPPAARDGILTYSNGTAAYIEGARWLEPAEAMFAIELDRAFRAGPVRLMPRGRAGVDWALRLNVQKFETDYRNGPEAPPVVVIEVRAALTRANVRQGKIEDLIIRKEIPAGENRVGAIVPAYNAALGQVFADLRPWVEATTR